LRLAEKCPKNLNPVKWICVSHKWGGKTLATVIRIQGKEVYWLKDNATGKDFFCGAKWIESIEETKH
jgi:hypothetical protein